MGVQIMKTTFTYLLDANGAFPVLIISLMGACTVFARLNDLKIYHQHSEMCERY